MLRILSRVAGAVLLAAFAFAPGVAYAQMTTGSISGRVTSEETGKPMAGVTVTVQGPALSGEQTEFTDSSGSYLINELPPGSDYVVQFYFGNVKVERAGLTVSATKTISVSAKMPATAEQKIVIIERAPNVDVANTNVGTTVSQELVRNAPIRGRTYDAVLQLAPGAASDATGYTFAGAQGPENAFLIDGLNTTNPAFGLIGTQLSLEFIKETEIIVGGYNAEFGRATGGIVNVVTKSGSNEFHGGVWINYAPFTLTPTTVARLGEGVASIRRGGSSTLYDNALDFGFDLGGPIVKDRVWFYLGFAPTFINQSYDRILRTRTADADGNPVQTTAGGCPPYLSGTDAALCEPTKASAAKVDEIGAMYNKKLESASRLYNYIAKLTFRFNDNNNLSLAYIGSPSTFNGVFDNPRNPNSLGLGFNGNVDSMKFDDNMQVHDAVLRFVSKLLDRRLQLDVLVGYHYEHNNTLPQGTAGSLGSSIDQRVSPLTRFEDVPPCAPQMINGKAFNPCPVSNYQDGGFGFSNEITNKRFVAQLGLTYFLKLGGTHALKLGGDFEENWYVDHRFYTGGANGGRYRIRANGGIQRTQFGTVVKDANGMETVQLLGNDDVAKSGFIAETNTTNFSAYLRDSWNLSFLPGFTLNAGVRWEAQQVKDINGVTQIGIYDNWAPRVGFAYDFTQKGKSKLYASYGRFYESIPLDINDRQFSGEGLVIQTINRATAAATPGCIDMATERYDVGKCAAGFPTTPARSSINGGTFGAVSPTLKGQYTNEVVAGLQYDVGWDVVLGAAYIHRDLGRVIEDISPNGGIDYIIGNPGDKTDQGVVNDLQKKIEDVNNQLKTASGEQATTLGEQKAKLVNQLALYKGVENFEAPKRDYNALQITAQKRFSNNFILLASYTYSRTLGNYPGLFSNSNGQLDPNISSQYDLRELLLNRNGPLPTDRPHNLKITGSYVIPLGSAGGLTLGLNYFLLSGTPIEVLGFHPLYGPNETFILPRGSGGRLPTLHQVDAHIAWGRQFGKQIRGDVVVDLFNVLNRQEVIGIDQAYTNDNVSPIPNGTYKDLANLKTTDGSAPHLNPNYGTPTGFQSPFSMRLGLRLSF